MYTPEYTPAPRSIPQEEICYNIKTTRPYTYTILVPDNKVLVIRTTGRMLANHDQWYPGIISPASAMPVAPAATSWGEKRKKRKRKFKFSLMDYFYGWPTTTRSKILLRADTIILSISRTACGNTLAGFSSERFVKKKSNDDWEKKEKSVQTLTIGGISIPSVLRSLLAW